jgi:hypothetical protein
LWNSGLGLSVFFLQENKQKENKVIRKHNLLITFFLSIIKDTNLFVRVNSFRFAVSQMPV